MTRIPETTLYKGIQVDLLFGDVRPAFGDLFAICGYENPNFPPTGTLKFDQFEDLQFSQIDDHFGVRTLSGEGDDVALWLFPLVGGEVVDHHRGPFDGVRLTYNVLRNPIERSQHFIRTVSELSANLPVTLEYGGVPGTIEQIRDDIQGIAQHWAGQDITVGSAEALQIDY